MTDLAAFSASRRNRRNRNPGRRYPCAGFFEQCHAVASATAGADDAMSGAGDNEIYYATGWTISGVSIPRQSRGL